MSQVVYTISTYDDVQVDPHLGQKNTGLRRKRGLLKKANVHMMTRLSEIVYEITSWT